MFGGSLVLALALALGPDDLGDGRPAARGQSHHAAVAHRSSRAHVRRRRFAEGSSSALAHRTLADGSTVVVGIDFADDRTWSAHLDAQGNIASQGSHNPDLGAPSRNLLVRDDELRGVGLSGLDPATGESLWTSDTGCSEPLPGNSLEFAPLTDDTLAVALYRDSDTELLYFDSLGTLTGREQFPEIDTFDRPVAIVPDAHAGALLVGEIGGADDNAYVAYVHADQTRRWVVSFGVPGDVIDAAIEADERLWVLGTQGVVAIALEP